MSKGIETRELLTRIRASKLPSNGSVLRIAALSAGRNALAQSGQTFDATCKTPVLKNPHLDFGHIQLASMLKSRMEFPIAQNATGLVSIQIFNWLVLPQVSKIESQMRWLAHQKKCVILKRNKVWIYNKHSLQKIRRAHYMQYQLWRIA